MPPPPHPFDPLTPNEISRAATVVRPHFGQHQNVNFRVVTLQEPPKKPMLFFMENPTPENTPARSARVDVLLGRPVEKNEESNEEEEEEHFALFEFLVDLDQGKVVGKQHHRGRHSYIDTEFMKSVERACLADEGVREQVRGLGLPEGAEVVVEPWAYATDGEGDMRRRVTMCWFYLRLGEQPDMNYYAYPLDLCAEVDEDLKVTKVYRLPLSPDERVSNEQRPFDHGRIHPAAASEYHPDLRPSPRTTTKPYHVVQPEGPSFTIEGQKVSWEKWSFRVGFNYREGLTLHDIRYDGRSLFYRLSLAEMFVPYGDPRAPYPRKAAFDLGNDGAGINANNLQLGCDCLGTIKYFDAWHNDSQGSPVKLPNVICCHEQDDGILWKHTNFRTQNAVVARSRILVLQTIITVSNYEYIFAFHFSQDASLTFEVRATGILSTVPAETNPPQPSPFGTRVGPGVLAPYHQHLFSLRIDPAIDGQANTLFIEETLPLPPKDNPNPHQNGYTTHATPIPTESGHDLNHVTNRSFKIVNESRMNPTTLTPVGFKLLPAYSQSLLAHPSSFHARRSEFAQHAVWVTRYADGDLFPAGKFTMQSRGGEGIASGIEERRRRVASASAGGGSGGGEEDDPTNVRNTDIVVWHSFGSTHNPRIEDWPVMPCEKITVGLKPVNFFGGNPGVDVAPARGEESRSVIFGGGGGGEGCCEERKV